MAKMQASESRVSTFSIANEIEKLKMKKGKDILIYDGHSFASSLIGHDLIDEYYLSS